MPSIAKAERTEREFQAALQGKKLKAEPGLMPVDLTPEQERSAEQASANIENRLMAEHKAILKKREKEKSKDGERK